MTNKQIERQPEPERPDGWSDERWQKYLEWWRKLPGYSEGDDVSHLVVVGTKEKPSDNEDVDEDEDVDNEEEEDAEE